LVGNLELAVYGALQPAVLVDSLKRRRANPRTKSERGVASNALAAMLGHRFADPGLLVEALTHPSAAHRVGANPRGYQRLEFLGDRVLGLVVAELLWRRFPREDEGALTRRHVDLVRRETLTGIARALDLSAYLRVSAGEDKSGLRDSAGVLADCCEALIGALYLDGGIPAARSFIAAHLGARIAASGAPPRDPKTALQEWAQARGAKLPHYEVVEIAGPPHRRRFTVRVRVQGVSDVTAWGPSKQAAEIAAATAALAALDGKA
jgi:ribonuclease III